MKMYISADIEGITGTVHWDETEKKHPDYGEFRDQMTAEVAAACEGALAAGAVGIVVKDAHDSARNLLAARLPRQASLHRGWSGHPYMMMDGIDSSFKAAAMIGYHARAGSPSNPLSHTMSGKDIYFKVNGRPASEFMINAWIAALENVPVVFVSGDAGICAEAAEFIPGITCVAVKEGRGDAAVNKHPQAAVDEIRAGVQTALTGDVSRLIARLPDHFVVEISYKEHAHAYRASFFPGVSLKDSHTIVYETGSFFDVLRLNAFVF